VLHQAQDKWENQIQSSLSHIKLSKLVNLLTSTPFFHSLHIVVVLCLPLLSPFVALLSPLVLKYQIDLSIILLLFYGTIFHFIYVRLFITSLLLLFQTRLCLIFQPLFSLTCWKPISFTLTFLLSLYSPRLSQNWYLRYWPSFVFSSSTHLAIIHCHIIHANFYVIWLASVYNKWSFICSTFLGTINLLHLFSGNLARYSYSPHLVFISYFSYFAIAF